MWKKALDALHRCKGAGCGKRNSGSSGPQFGCGKGFGFATEKANPGNGTPIPAIRGGDVENGTRISGKRGDRYNQPFRDLFRIFHLGDLPNATWPTFGGNATRLAFDRKQD